MDIVDSHLHLFNLKEGQYNWLKPENPPFWPNKPIIARAFNEEDLGLKSDLNLIGYVHIEAGFDNDASWREVDWVEQQSSLPVRSIGHVDLQLKNEHFITAWRQLALRKSFIGIRHILDEQLSEILTAPNCQKNLKFLNDQQTLFELQFDANSTADTQRVVQILARYPNIRFVLNHAGSCPINSQKDAILNWISNMQALALAPNLWVKCSGFEMVDTKYKVETAAGLIAKLCDIFGADRVMLASNFPLTLFASSYQDYWSGMINALQALNLPVADLVAANTSRIYRFDRV